MSELIKLSYIENKEERNLVYKKIAKEALRSGKFSWKKRVFFLSVSIVVIVTSYTHNHTLGTFQYLLIGFCLLDIYRLIALPFKVKKSYKQPPHAGEIHFDLLENGIRYEIDNVSIRFEFSEVERIDRINQFVVFTIKKESLKQKVPTSLIIYSNAFQAFSCDNFLKILKERMLAHKDDSQLLQNEAILATN